MSAWHPEALKSEWPIVLCSVRDREFPAAPPPERGHLPPPAEVDHPEEAQGHVGSRSADEAHTARG